MARAGSSSSKSKPSKPAPQPKYFAEVALVYGSGEKMIYFNNQRDLDRFIIDVTKRKLDSHPLRFVDAANKCFIIRSFLFCEITING
jgi:hypothetical protein